MANQPPMIAEELRRPWSIAVFASRDTPSEIELTLQAATRSAAQPALIDLICNGNRALAEEVCESLARIAEASPQHKFRVWYLPIADKANAWNHYVMSIWAGAQTSFFLDGYCRSNEPGMQALEETLKRSPGAMAATSLPSVGPSAQGWREAIVSEGGLAGGFFAVRGEVVEAMRSRHIRLPLGLYGYDGLLGAMFAFGLDPGTHDWDLKGRVVPCENATWLTTERSWWRPQDLKTYWDRRVRAALRTLVGRASRDFMAVRRNKPDQLPSTTREFVLGWVAGNRTDFLRLAMLSPFCALAWSRLRQPQDWGKADQAPDLVATFGGRPVRAQAQATGL